MKFYAQINEENVCIGISSLSGEVNASNLIEIEEYSVDYLHRKYENGQWSEEKYPPEESTEPYVDPLDSLGQLNVQQSLKLNQLEIKLDTLGQAVTQLLLK